MMKKDQYFSIEVHLLNDDNLAAMMVELDAAQSFGIYMMLLTHLRVKDDYEASCSPVLLRSIARRYGVDVELLSRVIFDFGLFEVDEESQTFRSPYLDRVMQRLEERWRTNTENGKKGGRPSKQNKIAETPATTARKPNETQEKKREEKRGEEKRNITTVEYNSSNIREHEVLAETAAVAAAVAVLSGKEELCFDEIQPCFVERQLCFDERQPCVTEKQSCVAEKQPCFDERQLWLVERQLYFDKRKQQQQSLHLHMAKPGFLTCQRRRHVPMVIPALDYCQPSPRLLSAQPSAIVTPVLDCPQPSPWLLSA